MVCTPYQENLQATSHFLSQCTLAQVNTHPDMPRYRSIQDLNQPEYDFHTDFDRYGIVRPKPGGLGWYSSCLDSF